MSTHEYKGHTIDVWVKRITSNHYDWSVKAGDLPIRKGGETAPSEAVAESEARECGRRLIDELIAKGHG
jgi:hypothetical protein